MSFQDLKDLIESFYDFNEHELKSGATDAKYDEICQALDEMPDGADKDGLIMLWGPVEREWYAKAHHDGKDESTDPLDKISLADINEATAEAVANADGEEPEMGEPNGEESKEDAIEGEEESEEDIAVDDPRAEKKRRQREKAEAKKAKQKAANLVKAKQQEEINRRLAKEAAAATAASYAAEEQYRKTIEENRRRAVEAENMRRAENERQATEKIRQMEAETRRKQVEAQNFAKQNQGNYTNLYDEARREGRETFYDQQKEDHSANYKPQYDDHTYTDQSQRNSYDTAQNYSQTAYKSNDYSQNGSGTQGYEQQKGYEQQSHRTSYDTAKHEYDQAQQEYSQTVNHTDSYASHSDERTVASDSRQTTNTASYRQNDTGVSSYNNASSEGIYEQQKKQMMEDDYNATRQAEINRMRENERRMAEESRRRQEEAQRFAKQNEGHYTNAARQQERENQTANQTAGGTDSYHQNDQDKRFYEQKGRERYEQIHSVDNDVNRNQYQEGSRFVDNDSYRKAAQESYEKQTATDHSYKSGTDYRPAEENRQQNAAGYSSNSYNTENKQTYKQNYNNTERQAEESRHESGTSYRTDNGGADHSYRSGSDYRPADDNRQQNATGYNGNSYSTENKQTYKHNYTDGERGSRQAEGTRYQSEASYQSEQNTPRSDTTTYHQNEQDKKFYEQKGKERYEQIHSVENDVNRNQYQEGSRFVDNDSYRKAAQENYERQTGTDHPYRSGSDYRGADENRQQGSAAGYGRNEYNTENKQTYKQTNKAEEGVPSYYKENYRGGQKTDASHTDRTEQTFRTEKPDTRKAEGFAAGAAAAVGGAATGAAASHGGFTDGRTAAVAGRNGQTEAAGRSQAEYRTNTVDRDFLEQKGRERYEQIHAVENDTNRNQYQRGSRFVKDGYTAKNYGRSIGSGRDVASSDQVIYHAGERKAESVRGINIGSDVKTTEKVKKTIDDLFTNGGRTHKEEIVPAEEKKILQGNGVSPDVSVGDGGGGNSGVGKTAPSAGSPYEDHEFHGRHIKATGTLVTNRKRLPLLRLDRPGRLIYRFMTKPFFDVVNQVAVNGNDHVNTGKALALTAAGVVQMTVGYGALIGSVGTLGGSVLHDGLVNGSRFWLGTDHVQLLDDDKIQVANRVRAKSAETDYLVLEGAKPSPAKGFDTHRTREAFAPFKSERRLRLDLQNTDHSQALSPFLMQKGTKKVDVLNVREVRQEIGRLKGILRGPGLSEDRKLEVEAQLKALIGGLDKHDKLTQALRMKQMRRKGRIAFRRGIAMIGHVVAHEADGAVGSTFAVMMMAPEYIATGLRAAKVGAKFVGWVGKKTVVPVAKVAEKGLNVATGGDLRWLEKNLPGIVKDKKVKAISEAKAKVKNSKAFEALNGGIHNQFMQTKIGHSIGKGEGAIGRLHGKIKNSKFGRAVGKIHTQIKNIGINARKVMDKITAPFKKILSALNVVKRYVYIVLFFIFLAYINLLILSTAAVIIGNWIMPAGDVTKSLQYYVSYAQQCADAWYGTTGTDYDTLYGVGTGDTAKATPPTEEKHGGKTLWQIMNQKTSERGKYRIITVRYVDKNGNEIDSHDNLKEILSMINVKLQAEWPENDDDSIIDDMKNFKNLLIGNMTVGDVEKMISGLYTASHSWSLSETAKYKYYVEVNHGHPQMPDPANPAYGGDPDNNNTVVHGEVKGDAEGEACLSRTFHDNESSMDSDASEYRQQMDATYGLRGGCTLDKHGTGKYYAVDGKDGQSADSFVFSNGTTTISDASTKKMNERNKSEMEQNKAPAQGQIIKLHQDESESGGCAFGKHNPKPNDKNSWSSEDLAVTEGCQDEIWKYKYNTGDPHEAASATNRLPSGVHFGDCSIEYPSWVPVKGPWSFNGWNTQVTFTWGYAREDDEEQCYYRKVGGMIYHLPDEWNDAPYNTISFYKVGNFYYPQGTKFIADKQKLYQCQERYCAGHFFEIKTYTCPGHTEWYCDGNHQDANVEVRIDHFPEMFADDVESTNKYPMKAAAVTKLKLDHQDPNVVKADGTTEKGTKYYTEENGYPEGETVLDDEDNPDSKREKDEEDYITDARDNKNDLIFRWTQDARDAATQYTKSSWYEMYQETDDNGKVVQSLEGLDDATMELDENYIAQYKQIVKDSLDQLDNSAAMDGDVADAALRKKVIDNALSLVGAVPFESGGTKGLPADANTGKYFSKTDFGWNDEDDGEHAKENIKKGLSSGGLVSWVYQASGRDIDDASGSILKIWKWGHVYKMDESEDQLRPGDIGIVNDYTNRVSSQVKDGVIYNHVGIYLGTNSLGQKLWIESSPTTGVVSIVSSNAYVYFLKMGATSDRKNMTFGDAGGGSSFAGDGSEGYVYRYLKKQGLSDEAIAGIFGNMACEGGVTGWNNAQDGMAEDVDYTAKVDSGAISRDEFIHDGIGYGPVQLTFWTMKAALYDNAKAAGKSIADPETMMKTIVQLYSGHFSAMNSAGSVEAAADYWLDNVEKPRDRNAAQREANARAYYNNIKNGDYDYVDYLETAINLANDDNYYYEWGGHGKERGGDEYGLDCAGFVAHVLYVSGIDIGYVTTQTMGAALKSAGFQEIPYTGMASLQPGDILVNPELHTEIYVGNGQVVGSRTDTAPKPDQTSVTGFWEDGWVYVYRQG